MLKASSFLTIALLFCLNMNLPGQIKAINRDKYKIHITKSNNEIIVDGLMDEDAWLSSEKAHNFTRVLPTDTGFAAAATEVKLTYTSTTLFLGIVCYDPTPGKRPVESLRHDFSFMKNDNFIVFIDTYNDQTNGFAFGVSAAGAKWDGVQSNGGAVNLDWDIKWRSAVKNYDDRWEAEFAIPFRSIRYHGGDAEWGINFSRQDLKTAEKSSWAPMPRQFATATLAYTGSLVWDKPLPSTGPRFSLIPYISGKTTQDKQAGEDFSTTGNAGIDAKLILSTSMNLDLTVNPDYSQVEVDRQVTNLDRFELFFPEKRQFYLENSDLFAQLGNDNLRPFFSRRIGLSSPVQAGARLSGKIGNNWRLGLMDIQTGEKEDIKAGNFTVAALQRQVFSNSNITAFVVNKQLTGSYNDTTFTGHSFNRVAGIEYNLASTDNRWTGKAFYHQSFYPGASGNAAAVSAHLTYATQFLNASLSQSWVGSDYLAEVGYIRRRGYYEIKPRIYYKFFPSASKIANHGPVLEMDLFLDASSKITDREVQLTYQVEWMDKSVLKVDLGDSYLMLLNPFDPTNTGGMPIPTGTEFKWNEISTTYTSDIRRPFNFMVRGLYGGFYDGTRLTLNGELYYRIQPYSSLALVGSYNKIDMSEPYNSAELILIGPRLDLTFTDKLFLTSFVQYNNQIDNLNLNLRFQWRFAPVSDLYIVYTENSFPTDYRIKNRGLVLKLSYWFN